MTRLRPTVLSLLLLAGAMLRADNLPSLPARVRPLSTGSVAPAPSLVAADGTAFDLRRALAEKPTILIFYCGGWCPYCNRHLAALAEAELPLRALGLQIIGITPDAPAQLGPTAAENHVRYRLLSDRAMRASGAYGVAFRLSPAMGRGYTENGIDLPPAPDGDGFWQPVPAAFIVSRDGIIRFVYSNDDPLHPIDMDDLLVAAKAAAVQ